MEDFPLSALVKYEFPNRIKMHKMKYSWHWHFRSSIFLLLLVGVNKIKHKQSFLIDSDVSNEMIPSHSAQDSL